MKQGLSTSEIAREADVNIQTLRYYERRKLLALPPRTEGGFRMYPVEAIQQIRFIKRAQGLGFSLDEIQDLLRLSQTGKVRCRDVRERVDQKIGSIDEKIAQLQHMRRALQTLASTCSGSASPECPILEELERPGATRRGA